MADIPLQGTIVHNLNLSSVCKDAVSNCQTCNSTLSTVTEGVTAIVCTACEPGFYIVISTEVTCAGMDNMHLWITFAICRMCSQFPMYDVHVTEYFDIS